MKGGFVGFAEWYLQGYNVQGYNVQGYNVQGCIRWGFIVG